MKKIINTVCKTIEIDANEAEQRNIAGLKKIKTCFLFTVSRLRSKLIIGHFSTSLILRLRSESSHNF